MYPTIRNCGGLLQDGHEQVADENEKFETYLLVSDLDSILQKSLCNDLILCGERDIRTFLRVNISVADGNHRLDRLAERMKPHPMPFLAASRNTWHRSLMQRI